ncbi:MAG TPA: D-alanine--D-alanine ligase [Clostridiales bacterium]|nr:D-alanine--D-alanine ligase [Clostridiales bacterium]
MNIVVLAGGLSTERDVSIITGKMVLKALRDKGNKAILLDVFMGYNEDNIDDIFDSQYDFSQSINGVGEVVPDLDAIKASRDGNPNCFLGKNVIEICTKADIVFMALHGDNGENGKLQATFDILGIKYTGTGYLGSALALNKALSKKLFVTGDIPTPEGHLFVKAQHESLNSWNTFPCVVKPCSGGSSVGVSIVNTRTEFEQAMADAYKYEDEVLVEQYIKGREFSIGVLGHTALPIIEIRPKNGFYDYKNKYQAGLTDDLCPAPLPQDITIAMQNMAVKVYDALMLETYGRVDFLLDENNNMYCLEANTLPGMTPTSLLPQEAAVLGYSHGELCQKIIDLAIEKYIK